MFRKIFDVVVTRNFQVAGTSRSSTSWRFYEQHRYYNWRERFSRTGNKRQAEPKVFIALAVSFSFKEFGISDERYKSAEKAKDEFDAHDDVEKGWEVLREEKDFRALRRRLAGPRELYEYKCAGTYWDISARSFLDAQNDVTYRSEWDGNIISLEVLQEEGEHELLRWVSKFPYPLHAREYIYVRRTWISEDKKIVVVESEIVPEEVIPKDKSSKNVRVATYTSRMAIRAHNEWDSHGVDYILTYSDNPEANIPRYIYNWMVNQGGPYFLKQVHKAALEIEKSGHQVHSVLEKIISHLKKQQEDKCVDRENIDKSSDSEKATNEEKNKEKKCEESSKTEELQKKKEVIPGVNNKTTKTSQKLCA